MSLLPTPESLFQHGQALLGAGQIGAAQKAFRDAGRICKHGPSLLEIGHALHQTGDLSGAMAVFRRASAHDRSLSEAPERVGALLLEMGGTLAAVLVLRTALIDHPSVAILHFRLAEALSGAGRPNEAYVEAQRAQELAPCVEIDRLLQQLQPLAMPVARGRKTQQIHTPTPGKAPIELIPINEVAAEIIESAAPVAKMEPAASAMTSDLTEFQLPELLQLLLSRRATGKMEIFSEGNNGIIGLIKGQIVHATHNNATSLCSYLSDRHGIAKEIGATVTTPSQDAAVAIQLREQNILEEADLRSAIVDRITESLKVMMAWQVGYSSFVRIAEEEFGETFEVALDTQWAVFDAFRQLDEENSVTDCS